jgi:predicted nucleotidyltransferase
MDIDKIKSTLREYSPYLKSEYDVESIGIFGSFIRGEQNANSDLDLLVTFLSKPGLFKFISLENYLSDLLGIKVDLVMPSALKKRIGKEIRSEVISI